MPCWLVLLTGVLAVLVIVILLAGHVRMGVH
jgi:hypothetical protein